MQHKNHTATADYHYFWWAQSKLFEAIWSQIENQEVTSYLLVITVYPFLIAGHHGIMITHSLVVWQSLVAVVLVSAAD